MLCGRARAVVAHARPFEGGVHEQIDGRAVAAFTLALDDVPDGLPLPMWTWEGTEGW